MTEEHFDLRSLVRKVVADGVGPDPREVAAKVLELVPIGWERDAMAQMLPEFCRIVIVNPRTHSQRRGATSDAFSQGKWDLVRDKLLDQAWQVAGVWRFFGDLTLKDVNWLVEERAASAQELFEESGRLAALAKTMKARKAETVRDVPAEVLAKVMS